jgi:hypothetical protein
MFDDAIRRHIPSGTRTCAVSKEIIVAVGYLCCSAICNADARNETFTARALLFTFYKTNFVRHFDSIRKSAGLSTGRRTYGHGALLVVDNTGLLRMQMVLNLAVNFTALFSSYRLTTCRSMFSQNVNQPSGIDRKLGRDVRGSAFISSYIR